MKKLLKNSLIVESIILGLFVGLFVVNFWMMSLNFIPTSSHDTFYVFAAKSFQEGFINIMAFSIIFLFNISVIPLLFAFLSIFKKNNWGLLLAFYYFLSFSILLIVFQFMDNYLSFFTGFLMIVNFVFVCFIFVLIRIRKRIETKTTINLNNSNSAFKVLIINIIAIFVYLLIFFVPLYTFTRNGFVETVFLINLLSSGTPNIMMLYYSSIVIVMLLIIIYFFVDLLIKYSSKKTEFVTKSKELLMLIFIATSYFFLFGLSMQIFLTLRLRVATKTIAFLPMLLMIIIIFISAVLNEQYQTLEKQE